MFTTIQKTHIVTLALHFKLHMLSSDYRPGRWGGATLTLPPQFVFRENSRRRKAGGKKAEQVQSTETGIRADKYGLVTILREK